MPYRVEPIAFASVLAALALFACGPRLRGAGTERTVAVKSTPSPSVAARVPRGVEPDAFEGERKERASARAPLAEALIDAYTNVSPTFSPDGKRVLFGSSRGGSMQWYLADAALPSRTPMQVTLGPERVAWADFTRDGKSVLFSRDQSADENFRLYKIGIDPEAGKAVSLTPFETRRRDTPLEPRGVPGTLLYTQSENDSPAVELVVQSVAGGPPKVVYRDAQHCALLDTTADGKRVLLQRWVSASESVLIEVEIATGTQRRIHPAEGKKVSVQDARYAHDGKRVYVATDHGEEGYWLLALDVQSREVVARYKNEDPKTAMISGVQVAARGSRVALLVDAGNRNEVRLLDATTLAFVGKLKTPLGQVEMTRFSEDGSMLGLSLATADSPTEVFVANTTTFAVRPLLHETRPGLKTMAAITTSIESIKAFDGLVLPINVYVPQGAARKPVIVNFHGGPAWNYPVRWSALTRFFTALGYAVIEPNVRGSTGFGRAYEMADNREKRADWLRDLESVNAWVKGQPWADPERVVIAGSSYGGYAVLMGLTHQPTLWRAGIDMFGIADLRGFLATTTAAVRANYVEEFGDLEKAGALLDKFSPMGRIDNVVRPLFVYAGAKDPRVPRTESDKVVQALRDRKMRVEYMVSANEGHSLDRRENRVEFMIRAAQFLEDEMK